VILNTAPADAAQISALTVRPVCETHTGPHTESTGDIPDQIIKSLHPKSQMEGNRPACLLHPVVSAGAVFSNTGFVYIAESEAKIITAICSAPPASLFVQVTLNARSTSIYAAQTSGLYQ
jgi:hypothetical protein